MPSTDSPDNSGEDHRKVEKIDSLFIGGRRGNRVVTEYQAGSEAVPNYGVCRSSIGLSTDGTFLSSRPAPPRERQGRASLNSARPPCPPGRTGPRAKEGHRVSSDSHTSACS